MPESRTVDINFELIKQGNVETYEALFRSQYGAIARYANKIVRNSMVAEEIAQEVFLYIWEKRSQIVITGSLSGYLFSATKNKCINWLKSELPKIQATSDITETDIMEKVSTVDKDREQEIKNLVSQAVAALPTKCREIFVLSRYGGLTYEEIAEELDLSKKTVENQMGIALRKLRETLKPLLTRIND